MPRDPIMQIHQQGGFRPQMIDLYTKPNCPYCVQAKNLLNRNNQLFNEIAIGQQIMTEELQQRFPEARTAPVVVMDGSYIGGYKELASLFESAPQFLAE